MGEGHLWPTIALPHLYTQYNAILGYSLYHIDYKATEQSREIYGKDIINKIHDNGETLLHTAVNKGDKASVDSESEYILL